MSRNADLLLDQLSVRDRRVFQFDVRTIDWDQYLENYVLGTRHFILKDDPDSVPRARKHLARYHHHRLQLEPLFSSLFSS